MIETHEIRYFLAVCHEQNFTRAAERCRVAQPSLTRAIKKLEEKFGGLLFDRARGRIALTELGRSVYAHLEAAMSGIEGAGLEAYRHKRSRTTTLRLGVSTAIEPQFFERAIDKLLSETPGVRIDVREGTGDWIVNSLLSDEIDVGVSAGRDYPDLVEAVPFLEQRYGVALALKHPLARKAEVDVSDLKHERLISTGGSDDLELALAESQAGDVCLNAVITTNSEAWALALTAHGAGVTILPMRPAVHDRVAMRPLAGPVTRMLSLVTMRGRRRVAPADQFIRFARRIAILPDAECVTV